MGGKSRIAKKIAKYTTSHGAHTYIEPFVGGGAAFAEAVGSFETAIAADAHTELIEMYQAMQDGWTPPGHISEEEYSELKQQPPSPLRTFAGFGASFGGKWWGGYGRSKNRSHSDESTRNLERQRTKGMFSDSVTFIPTTLDELDKHLPHDLTGVVIYCDPPYAGTTSYKGVDAFDTTRAWEIYHAWAARGAHVYISEYSGPEEYLIDTFETQKSLAHGSGEANKGKARERLYYIPPNESQPTISQGEITMSTPSQTPDLSYSRPAQQVPETDMYLDNLQARLVSGHTSVSDLLDHEAWQHIAQSPVAIDIEAAGLGADAFDIRCVTAAWWTPTAAQSISTVTGVLLDPRDPQQANYIRRILEEAPTLVFHNATYDVPPLYQHGLITLDQIHKIVDTLVMARMAYTLKETDKSLEALATRDDLIALIPGGGSMSLAFKAHGYSRAEQGWAGMDIDQLPYRLGAMTDTVATLRLMQPLYDKCVHWLTSSPFEGSTVPRTPADAHYLIDREQTVNRAMMRRSAIGLRVDRDYLHTYQEQTQQEREASAALLSDTLGEASVGNGAHVVEYLDKQGLLPPAYPRTPTGKLKADKEAFASLPDHPLIQAHRAVADTDHILDYLSKVDAMASITGRVHPQVGVLGASATGRMAYRIPEFQQFPALARPIVVWDEPEGAMSLDWSSIEPVTMANCAGDHDFLHGFNTDPTTDLYDPIVKGEGIERKLAKKVMLATMYGQGVRRLAAELGISEDEARTAKKRVFAPMPATLSFMENIQRTGSDYGVIMTADGRIQSIPKDPADKYMGYKAVNYFCQGSAYSVLSEVVASCYRAGISDHIYLAMHDELVVDASVADQVRHMMITPPEWLVEFAGRAPVLRTDANPLPDHWMYV